MNTEINMTYRFTQDDEPTEEQLAVIMKEVGEEVRQNSEEHSRQLREKLENEYQKAKERYANLLRIAKTQIAYCGRSKRIWKDFGNRQDSEAPMD